MKKKDKYKLINYAINEYNQELTKDYKKKSFSKQELFKLLLTYKHSSMCEWCYCCYGLYQCCWEEPFFEGNWDWTQKFVDETIKECIERTAKNCKRDNRIAYYENEIGVHVIIIARDLPRHKRDYFITFTDKEDLW